MAAACLVHPYESSRALGIHDEDSADGTPSREALGEQFTFSAEELREYIIDNPMRAGEIRDRALDNRGIPAPYILPVEGGFQVGWYDGPPKGNKEVFFHRNAEDAATDYVLTYWGLRRLNGVPVSHRASELSFDKCLRHRDASVGARLVHAVRALFEKWLR